MKKSAKRKIYTNMEAVTVVESITPLQPIALFV